MADASPRPRPRRAARCSVSPCRLRAARRREGGKESASPRWTDGLSPSGRPPTELRSDHVRAPTDRVRHRRRSVLRDALDSLIRSVGLNVRSFGSPAEFLGHGPPIRRPASCSTSGCRDRAGSISTAIAAIGDTASDHLHHRSRRHPDGRRGDESRRDRIPHQAFSRPGFARRHPAGAGSQPHAQPRDGRERGYEAAFRRAVAA